MQQGILHKGHEALVQVLRVLICRKVYVRKVEKLCAGDLESKVLTNSLPDELKRG